MTESIKAEDISYRRFRVEDKVESLQKMIETELSEPYSIYLYRHFAIDYPELTIVAEHDNKIVGCILGKYEDNVKGNGRKPEDEEIHTPDTIKISGRKGYIAMIAVLPTYRKKNIGKHLVKLFLEESRNNNCDYVQLETEICNIGALRLYESRHILHRFRICEDQAS
jgi:N-alpha-acetyltransferase 30